MPNLATPRTAHKAHFTHAEWRKVVVEHKALRGLSRIEQFNPLLIILGAQRRRHQGLRFTASKDCRAVSARQHSHLASDGTDLIKRTAIRTAPVLQHLITEDSFF